MFEHVRTDGLLDLRRSQTSKNCTKHAKHAQGTKLSPSFSFASFRTLIYPQDPHKYSSEVFDFPPAVPSSDNPFPDSEDYKSKCFSTLSIQVFCLYHDDDG